MNLSDQALHVLFVDDDANIRTVAQLGLEGLTSWSVELAASGYEALEKAVRHIPDLILLDVMMPGLDGKETFTKLQADQALQAVPVIFITAKVQNREVEEYMNLGAAGIITKPFDPMKLPDEIAELLATGGRFRSKSPCA